MTCLLQQMAMIRPLRLKKMTPETVNPNPPRIAC
jgi:hypothetical protein